MSRSMLKLKINFKLLEAYKKVHGNLKIPDNFIVPVSVKFPKYLHGSLLGEYVSTIRSKYMKDRNYFEVDDKIKADEMGFVWNARGTEENIAHQFETRPKAIINFKMLETYHKLHGDLDVAKHFVVPNDSANWPAYMQDSHLGKYVEDLRITNVINPAFFTDEERERLNSMDFLWKKKDFFTFDTIMTALESYKALHGTLKISENFVVPKDDPNFPASTWGMKLFGIANYIRTEAYLTEEQLKTLWEIGFDLSAPEKHDFVPNMEFNLLYKCLETFKSIHGDLLIPYKYIVPEGDINYPSESWGAKLGSTVFHMRFKHGNELSDSAEKRKITNLGFVWNVETTPDFSTVWSALESYKTINQDVLVPKNYVVPLNNTHFPEETWGLPLGKIVSDIRHKEEYSLHRKELLALGFDFRKKVYADFDITFSALKAYQAVNEGSSLIPTDYVVPRGSTDFPESTWGLKLGRIAYRIRNGSVFAKEKDQLETLGFTFSQKKKTNNRRAAKQHYDFDVVFCAFEIYKELHGHLQVPQKFVIEANDVRFPPESWGLQLGQTLSAIIHTNRYATYRNELTELGINFDEYLSYKVKKHNKLDVIITALQTYKNIYHHFNIPQSYVVPSDSNEFPLECRDLNLGKIVYGIRKKNNYAEYYDILQQIGFHPTSSTNAADATSGSKYADVELEQFNIVYDALKTFKELNGNLEIPKQYVVPANDTTFPQSAKNMKLGLLLHAISNNKIYSEYREKLDDLGVVFHANLTTSNRFKVLFENVFNALQIYKQVNGNLDIENDYVIEETDYDYPAKYWKMELGKIATDIRTKDKFVKHRQELINIDFPFVRKTSADANFPVVRQALLDYKAKHGNMNVPKRFVVPLADKQFKVEARGMKLGSVAHNIRWNLTYVNKRAQLEEMGFEFKENKKDGAPASQDSNSIDEMSPFAKKSHTAKFKRIFDALSSYKQANGDLNIPRLFKVPFNDSNYPETTWGLGLGDSLLRIRTEGKYSAFRKDLETLGVDFSESKSPAKTNVSADVKTRTGRNHDETVRILIAALKSYKELFGNYDIAQNFVVPEGSKTFPSDAWGLKLGFKLHMMKSLNHFKEYREQFEAISIDFGTNRSTPVKQLTSQAPIPTKIYTVDDICSALTTYTKINGNACVPKRYAIPKDDVRFDEVCRGMKLGQVVEEIKLNAFDPEHYEKFNKFNYTEHPLRQFEKLRDGLVAYEAVHGSYAVPRDFVVPRLDTDYPEHVRGFPLGELVYKTQTRADYKNHKIELEMLHINLPKVLTPEEQHYKNICTALVTFIRLYGDNLSMTARYFIPHGDSNFPKETWGMKLGRINERIRSGISYQSYRTHLHSLGVRFNKTVDFVVDDVKQNYVHNDVAAAVGKNTNNNIISSNSNNSNGNSGNSSNDSLKKPLIAKIKTKKIIKIVTDKHAFNKLYSALKVFKQQNKHVVVPQRFCVPINDTKYPENTWGMKLGASVANVRYGRTHQAFRNQFKKLGVIYMDEIESKQREKTINNAENNTEMSTENSNSNKNSNINSTVDDEAILHQIFLVSPSFAYKKRMELLRVYKALRTYKEVCGDFNIPQKFVIQHGDANFAEDMWGLKLGAAASNIRIGKSYAAHRELFTQLGFEFGPRDNVFTGKPYSEHIYKPKLVIIDTKKSRYEQKLKALGIDITADRSVIKSELKIAEKQRKKDEKFNKVFSALQAYKNIHNNLIVPNKFIVPHNDENYPQECWGMLLGRKVYEIRKNRLLSDYRAQLEEIGFVYKEYKPIVELD